MSNSVYMISDNTGHVKIGVATISVSSRLKELQVGNPNKLKLLRSFPVFTEKDAYSLESALHAHFKESHAFGEWFFEEPILTWLKDNEGRYAEVIHEEFDIWLRPNDETIAFNDIKADVREYLVKACMPAPQNKTADNLHVHTALTNYSDCPSEKILPLLCTLKQEYGKANNLYLTENSLTETTLTEKKCKYFLVKHEYLKKDRIVQKKYYISTAFCDLISELGYIIHKDIRDYDINGNYSNLIPKLKDYKDEALRYYEEKAEREEQLNYSYLPAPVSANRMTRICCIRMINIINAVAIEMDARGYKFGIEGSGTSGFMLFTNKREQVTFRFEEDFKSVKFVPTTEQKQLFRKGKINSLPDTYRKYFGTLKLLINKPESYSKHIIIRDKADCPLEEQIAKIIDELIYVLSVKKAINEEKHNANIKTQKKEFQIEEEYLRTKKLCSEAIAFDLAQKIRRMAEESDDETYKSWANEKADWLDPTKGFTDSILSQNHKNTIINSICDIYDKE